MYTCYNGDSDDIDNDDDNDNIFLTIEVMICKATYQNPRFEI
jgi:hypothetical protein